MDWTRMPPPNTRLNPENSIAAKVKWLHIGGLGREYFSGAEYTNELDAAFRLLSRTEWGQGAETRNVAGQAALEYPSSTLIDNPGSSWTIFYVGRVDLTAGNAPGLCSRRTTNATGYYGMYVNIAGANDDISLAANGGSLVLWNDSAISLRTGVPFVAVGIAVGTSDARLFVKYIDSPMQTATSSTTLTSGSGTHKTNIGQLSPDGERSYGVHMLGGFSTEAWSDDEAISFVHNPFQIFKPNPRFAFADIPDDVRHVPIQVPRTEQPPSHIPLDKKHPLYRYVAGVVNSANGLRWQSGPMGSPLTTADFVSLHATTKFEGGVHGQAVVNDSTTDTDNLGIQITNGPSIDATQGAPGITLLFVFNEIAAHAGGKSFCQFGTFSDFFGSNGADELRWRWASQYVAVSTGMGIEDGQPKVIAAEWQNDTVTGGATYWRDGRLIDSVDALGNLTSAEIPALLLDNDGTGFGQAKMSMPLCVVLAGTTRNGDWTSAMMESLTANPWQIFEPRTIFAPINEALPDVANIEIERNTFPMKPPL